MQFIKLFLLASCLSITNANDGAMEQLITYVNWYADYGEANPIDSSSYYLTLSKTRLGKTAEALVIKGACYEHEVAVKFFTIGDNYLREHAAYEALCAIDNDEVETIGIPKVYYTGLIFGTTGGIVMTLLEESLHDRWIKQRKYFETYTIFQVFLQSVEVLKYMHTKEVVHNDIKPQNIFFRDDKVFIADFDGASTNGIDVGTRTPQFASSKYWDYIKPSYVDYKPPLVRTAIDDLESLVYSIWFIKGINSHNMDGFMISNQTYEQNIEYVTGKCQHFNDIPAAVNACLFICKDEMLSKKEAPNYDEIIHRLKYALHMITKKTGQAEFEWLRPPSPEPTPSPSSSKSKSKYGKLLSFGKKRDK